MKGLLLFLLIAIPIIALLAFGLTRDPRDLPSTLLGKPAPGFSLKTLGGKTVALESLRGKTVVLYFWATCCGPCFQEHSILQAVQKEYEKNPALRRRRLEQIRKKYRLTKRTKENAYR